MGRNHARILRDLGVPPSRLRMLRSFDPRSAAHPLDVEDPYYGTHDDFEDVFAVIEAVAARPARLGRRTARRTRGSPADEPPRVPAPAAVAGALRRRRSRSPTCASPCWHRGSSARTPRRRARTRRSPTRCPQTPVPVTTVLPHQDSSAPDDAVATGHRDRHVSARRPGAGPAPGGRRRPGVRGAGAVRRRRRADRAGRPRLRQARAGLQRARVRPAARRRP